MEKLDNLVKIENLTITFPSAKGTIHAVNHLDLEIKRGKITVIVGESGCGKTTTALSIGALTGYMGGTVKTGSILFDEKELLKLPPIWLRSIRKRKLSYIFQNPQTVLNPVLTVKKHLEECLPVSSFKKKEEKRLLDLVGLSEETLYQYPFELSGGMAQRLVIAMAIASRPELIIADEPIVSLDLESKQKIIDLLLETIKSSHTTLLLITHDLTLAMQTADYVAIMYGGQIVEYGEQEIICQNPLHPYTQTLFSLYHAFSQKSERPPVLKGEPPDPTIIQPGCLFAPRCNLADQSCRTISPPSVQSAYGSYVRCFHEGGQC